MKPLALLLGLLAFTTSIRAQLVADGATNTLVNVTNTVAGTLTVGTNGSFTLLVFSNNVLVTNTGRGIIGLNPTAKSNEVRVISPTARWQTGVMSVGSNGPSSRLVISSGGQVADFGAIVGRREPASNCTAIVTDPGSLWTHADGVLIGQSSGGNQLVVSNGGTMISPYGYAGDGGSGNKTVVTGTGSHWTNDTDFVVGWGGSSNQLIVENGGRVSDGTGTVGLSASAVNNVAIITDTGSLWSNRLDLIVGQDGGGNRLVVSNGASVVAKSNIVAGLNSSAVSNTIVLTGPGTSLQTGVVLNRLIIGSNAPFNRLVISNGATATAFFSEIGSSATSGTNEAVVTGTGSVWRTTVDMGVGKSGAGNRLTISDGGLVSCPDGFVGVNPSGSNNFAVVTGPGSMWSNRFNFFAGYQGANNQVIISNGATVRSDSATLGNDPTSKGNSLLVTGVGSMLSNGATLFVGGFGAANQLTTDVGAKVHNQNASVGFRSVSSNNNVLVSGVGTFWTTAGSLVVGDSGSGNRMTVSNGATVLSSNWFIGLNASSTGNCVVVDGGALFVTNSTGNGLLEIRRGTNALNGGLIEADILRMTNGTSGKLEFKSGTLAIKNSRVSASNSVFIGNGPSPATLHLAGNGTHDFTGTPGLTLGNNAILSGSGALLVQLVLNPGSTFSPGASIGKISGSTTAFLGGSVVMEISKNGSVLTNDQFQTTGPLTYGAGGVLTVTNVGLTALTDGDNFPLFSATNYVGTFFSITLPPLNPGLMWTNRLLVDGSLQVRPISPATVSTLAADALSASTERLNGRANPQAADTTAWFEWGTTTNYGNVTPPQPLGSGMADTNFATVLTGLTTDTYHYRAVVSNSLGVVFGSDRNFRTLDAYLKASNTETDDNFGFSVAASGDTVVIGVIDEDSNATGVNGNQINNSAVSAGAAYVFVRSGDSWTQQAYLKASNAEANDLFGWSVAVSGDTIVVGAIGESSNATGVNGNQSNNSALTSGAAYVFVRSGTNWSQQAYVKASNTGAGDQVGTSVALSGDTLVVGARLEDSNATGINGNGSDNTGTNSGAAYVFVRSGTNWTQQAYLKASNTGASDQFGNSVSVSADTVVVGAFGEDSNAIGVNGNDSDNSASGSGAAYVFARNGTNWIQQAYLKASNTDAGDSFGLSVGVSGDTVVVGADDEDSQATGVNGNQTNNSATNSGAAYVFVRGGTNWSQQAYLKASNTEANDFFGDCVSVSGNTIVVGAPFEDSNATGFNGNQTNNSASVSGAAYVFARSGTNWIQLDYLKASNAESGDIFADAVAVSGGTIVIAATGESSNATGVNGDQNNNSALISGAAYVFSTLIPPTLTIVPSGVSLVTLSWTPTTPGFALQETLPLAPVSWSNSPSGPTNPIILPVTGQTKFFRLIKP